MSRPNKVVEIPGHGEVIITYIGTVDIGGFKSPREKMDWMNTEHPSVNFPWASCIETDIDKLEVWLPRRRFNRDFVLATFANILKHWKKRNAGRFSYE